MKLFFLLVMFAANSFAQSAAPIQVSITSRDPWDPFNPKSFITNNSNQNKEAIETYLRQKPEIALKLNEIRKELQSDRIATLVSTIGGRFKDTAYFHINLNLIDLSTTVTVHRRKSIWTVCGIDTAEGHTALDSLLNLKLVKEKIVFESLGDCLANIDERNPPKLEEAIDDIINDENCP